MLQQIMPQDVKAQIKALSSTHKLGDQFHAEEQQVRECMAGFDPHGKSGNCVHVFVPSLQSCSIPLKTAVAEDPLSRPYSWEDGVTR